MQVKWLYSRYAFLQVRASPCKSPVTRAGTTVTLRGWTGVTLADAPAHRAHAAEGVEDPRPAPAIDRRLLMAVGASRVESAALDVTIQQVAAAVGARADPSATDVVTAPAPALKIVNKLFVMVILSP